MQELKTRFLSELPVTDRVLPASYGGVAAT